MLCHSLPSVHIKSYRYCPVIHCPSLVTDIFSALELLLTLLTDFLLTPLEQHQLTAVTNWPTYSENTNSLCKFSTRKTDDSLQQRHLYLFTHYHHHHHRHAIRLTWCKRKALQEHVTKSKVSRVLSMSTSSGDSSQCRVMRLLALPGQCMVTRANKSALKQNNNSGDLFNNSTRPPFHRSV